MGPVGVLLSTEQKRYHEERRFTEPSRDLEPNYKHRERASDRLTNLDPFELKD
jgi:hypothetical protein